MLGYLTEEEVCNYLERIKNLVYVSDYDKKVQTYTDVMDTLNQYGKQLIKAAQNQNDKPTLLGAIILQMSLEEKIAGILGLYTNEY